MEKRVTPGGGVVWDNITGRMGRTQGEIYRSERHPMIQWFRSLYIRLRVWVERNPWGSALPSQVPPAGNWKCWLFVGGRGAGKTWAGVRWVIDRAKHRHGPILIVAHEQRYCRDLADDLIVQSPPW